MTIATNVLNALRARIGLRAFDGEFGAPVVISPPHERILKISTTYQISLYGTDANPATLYLELYEK